MLKNILLSTIINPIVSITCQTRTASRYHLPGRSLANIATSHVLIDQNYIIIIASTKTPPF